MGALAKTKFCRTVFGRVRHENEEGTFIVELRLDGIHVHQLRERLYRRTVKLDELINLSKGQPYFIYEPKNCKTTPQSQRGNGGAVPAPQTRVEPDPAAAPLVVAPEVPADNPGGAVK